MENNVFVLKSKEDLTSATLRAEIISCVKKNSYALLRGLYSREEIRKKLPAIYKYTNDGSFYPSSGVGKDLIRTNMKKWSIGGHSPSQANLARFMVVIFNPLFCEDMFSLRDEYNKLIYVRDTISGREVMTDDKLATPKFNGTRVQIYPSGGGFLVGHIDHRAMESISDLEDTTYIQLVLLITEKGTDYKTGGAFVVNSKNEYIDVESHSQSGDIVVYDGNTLHGVEDIDPQKVFSERNIGGRAVALVTIYN